MMELNASNVVLPIIGTILLYIVNFVMEISFTINYQNLVSNALKTLPFIQEDHVNLVHKVLSITEINKFVFHALKELFSMLHQINVFSLHQLFMSNAQLEVFITNSWKSVNALLQCLTIMDTLVFLAFCQSIGIMNNFHVNTVQLINIMILMMETVSYVMLI